MQSKPFKSWLSRPIATPPTVVAPTNTALPVLVVSGLRDFDDGSRWLQTTAPISHGSSGGPLVLANGTIAGVTTLTRKDAQNLNFAIPVSVVRKFLSSEFRSRDIAEGASILSHETDAFVAMVVDMTHRHARIESQAGVLLDKAGQEMREGHYDQAIALAQKSDKSLPEKYKYLATYVLGRSNSRLAVKATADFNARYGANDHAIAAQRYLLQTTKLNPDFSPGLAWLVKHLSWTGNWPDALIESDALVKLMPRCAEALQLRAACYA